MVEGERLLLQLDSDPENDVAWGDTGRLFFCARGNEAGQGALRGAGRVVRNEALVSTGGCRMGGGDDSRGRGM